MNVCRDPLPSERRDVWRFLLKMGLFMLPIFLILGDFHTTPLPDDERSMTCRYDRELGWRPIEGLKAWYQGSSPFYIEQNSLGFRDAEPGPKSRPRILFLGDSFVWGYDAVQDQRFTEKLQARLPSWQVLNEGVSGYGTDQEYLMLQRTIDTLAPDVVFLVFTTENDRDDNSANMRYGYYKPYFEVVDGSLRLRGVPVERSLNFWYSQLRWLCRFRVVKGFVDRVYESVKPPVLTVPDPTWALFDALRTMSAAHHARFYVGLNNASPEIEAWLQQHGFPYVLLQTDRRFTTNGEHWTPAGHQWVADTLYRFIGEHEQP